MKTNQKNGQETAKKRQNWSLLRLAIIVLPFLTALGSCQKEDIKPITTSKVIILKDSLKEDSTMVYKTTKVTASVAFAAADVKTQASVSVVLSGVNKCTLKGLSINGVSKTGPGLNIAGKVLGDIIIPNQGFDVPYFSNPQETGTEIFIDDAKKYDLNQYIPANTTITINFAMFFNAAAPAIGNTLYCLVIEYEETVPITKKQ
jgi:hypothetical protein